MASGVSLRLRGRDLGAAARVCARAFLNAPHVAYFFPNEASRARETVELFRMRVRYGLLQGEVHTTSPGLEGLAVWLPSTRATMTMWRQIRSGGTRLYRVVGSDAVARMLHVAVHNDRLRSRHVPAAHWFLSILAVDPAHQRKGHATRLVESMLERIDREGVACYAETTEPELIAFYRRFGFEPGSESIVPGTDLTIWPLVRLPQRPELGA